MLLQFVGVHVNGPAAAAHTVEHGDLAITLEIRSAPGQGTCASLLLPLHEGSADVRGRVHA